MFAIRYVKRQEGPYAIALTWDAKFSSSALLEINLKNPQDIRILLQTPGEIEKNKNNIHLIEFVGDYLFVANRFGQVSIYRYPDLSKKIGGIYHQNDVNNIVSGQTLLVNTGVTVNFVMILEAKSDQRPGSLGIYVLK